MSILGKLGALVGFVIAAAVAGVLAAASLAPFAVLSADGVHGTLGTYFSMPDYLKIETPQQISTLYAQDGKGHEVAVATFYSQDRVNVDPDEIAQTVKDAAIDTEDPRFYQEGGVDVIGTIRATLATALGHGDNVQGGSSITQQYVKNVLVQQCERLSSKKAIDTCYNKAIEVTPERKLQEMRYASAVDRQYSKAQILTGYLNIVGLGGTTYGVQAGARYYFGTDAAHLTVPQAATLVAILNNPSNLRIDEPSNPKNGAKNGYKLTLERRDYVLDKMRSHNSISEEQYEAAKKTPITPKITQQASGCAAAAKYDAAYYCQYVRDTLLADPALGKTSAERIEKLDTAGLQIHTPLRLDLQAAAQKALSSYVPKSAGGVSLGGTNVTVRPGSGQIVTMVQNTDFGNSDAPGVTSVNYNTDQAYGGSMGFQTGSTFKPFTLAEWLKEGHTLNQYVSTAGRHFPFSDFHNSCYNIGAGSQVWNVQNNDNEAVPGSMSVMAATAQSINTAYANMGRQIDLCGVAANAKAMGVHLANNGPFEEFPSEILGTNLISPLTMAEAYAGFSNGGTVCTPIAVTSITDSTGKKVPFTGAKCHGSMPSNIANTVEYALQGVLKGAGTAATANPNDGVPLFAKTGTTDGDEQNWMITSSTNYTTAIWVGNASGHVGLEHFPLLQGTTGYTSKFSIAHQLLPVLDRAFGGAALPGPDPKLLGAVTQPHYTHKGTGPTKPAPAKPAPPKAPAPPSKGGGGHGKGH
ncbi:transglycosylase domain-containing protein [Gryllotalpicola daejeonensis]|uniref:Transglycosylase domain-containing protein n=1 Tax=Gryllotalpicola daejeonensis TaxID=993087 RepID=A0ABP7ZIV8_9MICO